jgi:hypothetical protein
VGSLSKGHLKTCNELIRIYIDIYRFINLRVQINQKYCIFRFQSDMPKNRQNRNPSNTNGSGSRSSNRQKSVKSHSSLETEDSRVDKDEIRAVLVRHWTSLDRARLHTFYLWLFVYSISQIFLFHYLCYRVSIIICFSCVY